MITPTGGTHPRQTQTGAEPFAHQGLHRAGKIQQPDKHERQHIGGDRERQHQRPVQPAATGEFTQAGEPRQAYPSSVTPTPTPSTGSAYCPADAPSGFRAGATISAGQPSPTTAAERSAAARPARRWQRPGVPAALHRMGQGGSRNEGGQEGCTGLLLILAESRADLSAKRPVHSQKMHYLN